MNSGRAKKKTTPVIVAILHNIRSLYNLGSMFRTADAAGIKKIYISGFSGTPDDPKVKKVALGAEASVLWEKKTKLRTLLRGLKQKGYTIVALEQSKKSVNFRTLKPKFPMALIVGNEVRGLAPAILKAVDTIVEIPMYGKKESLNVAVAFGIAAYEYTKPQ